MRDWCSLDGREEIRKAYGSFVRLAKRPIGPKWIESVTWVKAHQDLKKVTEDPLKLAQAKGNATPTSKRKKAASSIRSQAQIKPGPSRDSAGTPQQPAAPSQQLSLSGPGSSTRQTEENVVPRPGGLKKPPPAPNATTGRQEETANPSAQNAFASPGHSSPA